MVLSFYDTYWNDNFVKEQYDVPGNLNGCDNILMCQNSPGTREESVINGFDVLLQDENYSEYVEMYKELSNHLYLVSIALNDNLISNNNSSYGTYLSTLAVILTRYFDMSTNMSSNDVDIHYYNNHDYSDAFIRNKIVEMISSGTPVIIDANGIDNNGKTRAHTFVAYDYDEQNDEIYIHTGWHSNQTHVKMSELIYKNIYEILYINPLMTHSHSNNYFKVNPVSLQEDYLCPCSLLIPSQISIANGLYIDERPIFKWKTFNSVSCLNDFNAYYEFSILDYRHHVIKTISNIKDNSYVLSWFDYRLAVGSGPYFYAYVELINPQDYTVDDYYGIIQCKPEEYKHRTQIKPNEWGFEQRYFFESEGIRASSLEKNNILINTSRLRCGYIEDSFVVLSPRRAGAGRSYFEMSFDTPIYSLVYSLCLWSNQENLDGQAFMQIKDENGNWSNNINLQIDGLPTKEEGIQRSFYMIPPDFNFNFMNMEIIYHPIYGVRFEVTATPAGSKNKGRLCIDDIVLDENIPNLLEIPNIISGDGAYILNYGKTHP